MTNGFALELCCSAQYCRKDIAKLSSYIGHTVTVTSSGGTQWYGELLEVDDWKLIVQGMYVLPSQNVTVFNSN